MAVRHEKVIVELDDRFTSKMARLTASAAALDKELDRSGRAAVTFDRTTRTLTPSIDQLSGRLGLLARAAGALGPALIPVTTAAVPALAGLSTQLGFAAAGAGTAVLAFNGVGDALEALNEFQLEPTSENFAKLQEEMQGLGLAAREFVVFLDDISSQLQTVREVAQEGLLPGVQEGIDSLLNRLPEVRRIVSEIATASGDLMAAAGAELAGSGWDEFFAFLEGEARPALMTLGQTVGNVARGIAELWMAMDPLSDDFTQGMLEASEAFASWADNLSSTEGFQEFLAYVRSTGPQVLDTIGSLGNMLLQVAEAAAPLGGPLLTALEAVADAVAAIADSPIGPGLMTAVTAMSALSLATRGWTAAVNSVTVSKLTSMFTSVEVGAEGAAKSTEKATKGFRAMVGAAAGLAALQTGAGFIRQLHDAIDETLPGMQTLTSRLVGLTDGRVATLGEEFYNVAESIRRITDRTQDESITDALQAPFKGLFGEAGSLRQARKEIAAIDAALVNTVNTFGSAKAKAAFREFAENQGLGAKQTRTLLNLLPGYREALVGAANAARANGGAAKGAGDAIAGLRDEIEDTTTVAEDLATALDSLIAPTLNQSAATDAWVVALRDMRKAIREANGDLLSNSKAALAAREGMRGYVNAALDKAKADAEATGSGRQMAATLIQTRDHIVAQAKAAGLSAGEIRELVRIMGLTPKNLQTAIETPGVLNAIERVRALGKLYGLTPKQVRTLLSQPGMERSQAEIEKLAKQYDMTPKQVRTLLEAIDKASGTLAAHRAAIAAIPRSVTTTLTVTRVRGTPIVPGVADGGTIEGQRYPYGDKVLTYLAPGEEVISNRHGQADRHRDLLRAINANRLADGGTVQALADGGKVARRRDRLSEMLDALRRVLEGFDLSSTFGREPRNPTAAAVRDELENLRRSVRDAGGDWTKAMRRNAGALVKHARQIDREGRALERATAKQEKLTQKYDDQARALEAFEQQMVQFGQAVSGNFNQSPFNASVTLPGSGMVVTPELRSARADLAGVDAQYRSAVASGNLYEASRLLAARDQFQARVDELTSEAEQMASATGRTVTGLEAFQMTLRGSVEELQAFTSTMGALERLGLDGPLLRELYASGDLATAKGLLSSGAGGIGQAEDLFEERLALQAELEKQAIESVLGPQHEAMLAATEALEARVEAQSRRIDAQTATIERLENRAANREERLNDRIVGEVRDVKRAIANLPRHQETNRQKAGKRGRN